ncbi:hypothetical protein JCM11491_001663 [Sporobolomyces phaffii]
MPLPALSPMTSPARHSPQRLQAPRTAHHRQLNSVPGIINLPPSNKGFDPLSNPSASPSSRHRAAFVHHQPLAPKPLPTLDSAALGHTGEPKRRRRQKKSSATVAVDSAENPAAPPVQDGIPFLANAVDENGADQSTPTKSRRRRGRATRQTSPPLPESLLPAGQTAADSFPSTTPPQADQFSSHPHSQSVPPDLPPHQRGKQHHSSSGDEWDMPHAARGGRATANQRSAEPKENLSWQQELFKSAPAPRRNDANNHPNSPASRSIAPRTTRQSGPAPHSRHAAPRPALHASLSDPNASSSSANASLNWQQEMLLQSGLQTSTLTNPPDRRVNSASPTKASSAVPPPTTSSSMTPARQRQHRIKDSITFGDLDLSEFQDQQHSPASRHNSTRRTTPRRPSPPTNDLLAVPVTPTKQSDTLGPRYAGPTFHNSPAPSSLPVPSFVLRRQA